jgi:hypothetical protein
MEDDLVYDRSRKISKSEALEDQELAAEANLFRNFCETYAFVSSNRKRIEPVLPCAWAALARYCYSLSCV